MITSRSLSRVGCIAFLMASNRRTDNTGITTPPANDEVYPRLDQGREDIQQVVMVFPPHASHHALESRPGKDGSAARPDRGREEPQKVQEAFTLEILRLKWPAPVVHSAPFGKETGDG
jgi:hypothetical protein